MKAEGWFPMSEVLAGNLLLSPVGLLSGGGGLPSLGGVSFTACGDSATQSK